MHKIRALVYFKVYILALCVAFTACTMMYNCRTTKVRKYKNACRESDTNLCCQPYQKKTTDLTIYSQSKILEHIILSSYRAKLLNYL